MKETRNAGSCRTELPWLSLLLYFSAVWRLPTVEKSNTVIYVKTNLPVLVLWTPEKENSPSRFRAEILKEGIPV